MPRLWYPTERDAADIANELAAELFPDQASSSRFHLLGPEGAAMLESALALPRQPYYRTVYDKAAALLRSLIKNHPYRDGNKRIGMAVTGVFLMMNGFLLAPTSGAMLEYALTIAASEPDLGWQAIARWIEENAYPLAADGELVLAQILSSMPEDEDVRRQLLRRWRQISRFVEG